MCDLSILKSLFLIYIIDIKYDDRQIYFLYFKLKTTTKGDDCNENSRNNAGSSSLKYQLIDTDNEAVLAKGNCERIGQNGASLILNTRRQKNQPQNTDA